jgi:hypothetical protein
MDPLMHNKFHLQLYQIGYVHPAINATTVIAWNLYNSSQQLMMHWLYVLQKLQIVKLMTWVRDYKKQIATARQQIQPDQKFTAENVDLVTADELQQLVAQGAPGTPVGNQSILSYTTTRKNANNYITSSRFT